MARAYYDADSKADALKGKKIAVLGYGSQGHAHALNLKESGYDVIIGLYEGSKSAKAAKSDGFAVYNVNEAVKQADVVMILFPDHLHGKIYAEEIAPNLKGGAALALAHGFSIHFGTIVPEKTRDVFMVAPKGPGHLVRRMYQDGKGVPCLMAVYQDASGSCRDMALAYACGIGGGRAGVLLTTFKEETETDLFGEQAVLCGGATELVKAGFDTLVKAGYQPEIAYFECLNELKLIVDMLFEGGLSWMRYSISDTAEYGDCIAGPKVIDDHVRKNMQELLDRIQSGEFAREWILENQAGRPRLKMWRKLERELLIEQVGKDLRGMMPWMQAKAAPEV